MTGEMYQVNPEEWPLHFGIAEGLKKESKKVEVKPFDYYQGPYIVIGDDITVGSCPYKIPVQNMGVIRLWLIPDEDGSDFVRLFREDTEQTSEPFIDAEMGINLAKELLK